MLKIFAKASVVLLAAVLAAGCAAAPRPQCPGVSGQGADFQFPGLVQKVDSFHVVLDGSGSMRDSVGGMSKFVLAKNIVKFMNTAVSDMRLEAGLRTYGLSAVPSYLQTDLRYGISPYVSTDFAAAVDSLGSANGLSPLGMALDKAGEDLAGKSARMVVIVVSDGAADDGAAAAAQRLKNQLGSGACICTIAVGADSAGRELLDGIARMGGCGSAFDAKDLCTHEGMAGFVRQVFYTTAPKIMPAPIPPPKDSDGDGVVDFSDNCPNTPKGVAVDAHGCPLDSDKDGVPDYLDKCPGTPLGATVNERGCWVIQDLFFETAKHEVQAQYIPIIEKMLPVLEKNPGMKIVLEGHTDSRGGDAYNQALSQRRAEAVKAVLVQKGVDASRIFCQGLGETAPLAPNDTPANMAKNRRVEVRPVQ